MFKAFLITAFLLAPVIAQAACTGTNLIDTLPDDDRAELDAGVAAHPYPEGNVWTAVRAGSEVTVVGTLHLPDPRLPDIMARIGGRIDAADLVILEATEETEQAMYARMSTEPRLMFLRDGKSLIDLLGEDWPAVAAMAEARGLPPFLASQYQPWLLAITLSIPPCALPAMTSGEEGLDGLIEAAAKARNLPTAALDTPDVLFDVFAGGTLDEQVEMLRSSIALETAGKDLFHTMKESYFAGRHREIWEFSRHVSEDWDPVNGATMFDEMDRVLLVQRNQQWETALPEMLDGRNALIAVGAAHLSGETGVLSALARMGYTLERLPGF
ncbi:MAG: TraB/GumN family protein [Pseudomonadota bacterium]